MKVFNLFNNQVVPIELCGKGHNPGEPDVAQFQSSQGLKMHLVNKGQASERGINARLQIYHQTISKFANKRKQVQTSAASRKPPKLLRQKRYKGS
jgi:hypothetical protein